MRFNPVVQMLVLAVIAIGLFANTIDNGFVWDDWLVHLDSSFKQFTPAQITAFFTGGHPYPMSAVFNSIGYHLWGDQAPGYHVFNIIVHTIVTLAVYLLFRLLVGAGSLPFWGALVFLVHPVHAEPVAWISGHPDLLYTLFYIVAMILGVRAGSFLGFSSILSILFFLIALMAKPVAVTFPAVFLMVMAGSGKIPFRKALARALPYAGVAFFWLIHLRGAIGARITETGGSSPDPFYALRLLPSVVWQYTRSWFWPFDLSIHHDFTDAFAVNIGPALFIMCIVAVTVWAMRRRYWEGIGILWTALALSPMLNWPFAAASVYADRYLYLPSVGLSLAVASLGHRFVTRASPLPLIARIIPLSLILVFLAVLTVRYNTMWGDERLLYKQAVRTSTVMKYYFYNDLGTAYARRGQYRKAEEACRKSIELNPTHVKAYNNIAWICEKEGRWDEGIEMVNKALALNPDNFIAHNNLGNLRMGMRDFERAEPAYLEAIRIKPDFSSALFNVGRLNHMQGRLERAEDFYGRALQSNPHQHLVKRFLGDVAYMQKDLAKARKWWTQALDRDPNPEELRLRIRSLP